MWPPSKARSWPRSPRRPIGPCRSGWPWVGGWSIGSPAIAAPALDLTCLFLQGCAGDQGTGKWVSGTPWEDTVAMGDRFARGVIDGLRSARAVEEGELRVARGWLPLELDPFPSIAELETRLERAVHDQTFGGIVSAGDALVLARRLDELGGAPIVTLAIGRDVALAVLPGEVFLEHGLAIRAGSPFGQTLVAAYNDNTLQYIPTATAFPDGGYEVDGGWRYIRPGQGERMAAEALRLLDGLSA